MICGEPRVSKATSAILYDAKRLQADHADDDAAIRWARSKVSDPPVPMVLWRIEGGRREMVWMMAV